ncbi:unnamed protein product, partial [marine sediment metagenome]
MVALGLLESTGNAIIVGGTHSVAHAYMRILLENGGKFFTISHVNKILIENGRAKGIRLGDGTEIEARKLVLSTLNPYQLCFELVGKEHFSRPVLAKVEDLRNDWTTLMWYTWALSELPEYLAAEHNPDFSAVESLTISSYDTDIWTREHALRQMGKNPPVENTLSIRSYSQFDKNRAP